MKQTIRTTIAILFFAVTTSAVARDVGDYIGVDVSRLSVNLAQANANSGFINFDHLSVDLRGGGQINSHFAVEGRLRFAIDNAIATGHKDRDNIPLAAEIKQMAGVYLRVSPDAGPFTPYLIAGWSAWEGEVSGDDDFGNTSGDDFSWGVGVDYQRGWVSSVGVEYMNYHDKDGEKITGISANFTVQF